MSVAAGYGSESMVNGGLMRSKTVLSRLLLIALVAAGCSDDTGPTTTAAAATTQTPAPTQAPTAATQAPPNTPAPALCPAAGMPIPGAQEGLPDTVGGMRNDIVGAASECDLERFAELAREGPGEFVFSGGEILFFVGPPDEAARFLSGLADDGTDVLADAVGLLDLPFGFIEDPEPWALLDDPALAPLYVWPAAAAYSSWTQVPDPAREAIRALLGGAALQFFAEQDMYLGPRLGITEAGDWVFQHFGDL